MTQDAIDSWVRGARDPGCFVDEGMNNDFAPPLLFKTDSEEDRTRCYQYASWTTAAAQYPYSRRYCVSDKGYFGLFPPGTNIGDQIWVILGAQTPFLLRNLGSRNAWELVGECYVYGFMDGGALRGAGGVENITLY
jgi:hypothetical protein